MTEFIVPMLYGFVTAGGLAIGIVTGMGVEWVKATALRWIVGS